MKCQKCGNEFRGKICPDCGYDARAARKTTGAAQGTASSASSAKNSLIAIGLAVGLILVLVITILTIFEKSYSDSPADDSQGVAEMTVQDTPTAPEVQSVQRGSQNSPTQGADLTGTPLLFEGGGVSIQLQSVFLVGTDLNSELTLLVTNNTKKVKWVRTTDYILNGRPQTKDNLISVEPGDSVLLAVTQNPVREGSYAGTSLGSIELTFHVTDSPSTNKNQVTDSVKITFGS